MPEDTLVVIPCLGLEPMTQALVKVALLERVDVLVIDHGGQYEPVAQEMVHRPGRNLGWLGAANYGLARGFNQENRDYVCILNNDVVLSWGFFAGLKTAALYCGGDVGLVGPLLDEPASKEGIARAARQYFAFDPFRFIPYPEALETRFVHGSCLYYTRAGYAATGPMDESQQPFGWGTDVEVGHLCRQAGLRCLVSKWSHLRHTGEATVLNTGADPVVYAQAAREHVRDVFRTRYGGGWQEILGFDFGIGP
jgi:hypothetical protein